MTTAVRPAPLVEGPATVVPTLDVGLPAPRPRVAWRPVLVLAGVLAVVLGVASAFYGAFGDELYFIAAGRHGAWGYADQPPLVPWLAATLDHLAPGNLVVLRLPVTLAGAGHVVLAAVLAAELGGARRAQLLTGAAVAISPFFLATDRLLATSTLDPVLWTLLLWLLARWLRTEREGRPDDRLLLAAGPVLAVSLAVKFLIPLLLVGLLVGVLVAGPRRLLGRPLLWVALGLAAASTVPTVLWQASHGWPQLHMGGVVNGEAGLTGNRWCFLPFAAWDIGLLPGVVLAGVGFWALLRAPALRTWRPLGVAAVVTTVVLIVAGGRPYYLTGLAALLLAAGAVGVTVARPAMRPARLWSATLSVPSFVLSGLLVAALALPIGPASWRVDSDFVAMGQVGWQSLADDTAGAWRALPPEVRAHTTVIAFSYWYASALEVYGPARGLPPVYSGHRGAGYFGVPPDSATTALLVGPVRGMERFCSSIVALPPHVDPRANPGLNGIVTFALCRPSAPWSAQWGSIMHMD